MYSSADHERSTAPVLNSSITEKRSNTKVAHALQQDGVSEAFFATFIGHFYLFSICHRLSTPKHHKQMLSINTVC